MTLYGTCTRRLNIRTVEQSGAAPVAIERIPPQADAKRVQQIAGTVKIETTMERYGGDATECFGYQRRWMRRVLQWFGAVVNFG